MLPLQTPTQNKNYVVPKYGGYVPGMKANNELGRSLSKTSRRCFDKEDEFRQTANRTFNTG